MADFVIREWTLKPYPEDMAPPHIHHRGDEAFYVLEGAIEVLDGERRHRLGVGEMHVVAAGSVHTFATVDDVGARVLVVMTPEIDALITALHSGETDDIAAVWTAHHSSVVR